MARPKEFDRDEALDRAMHVFWEKGYDCASMQDLVDAMGIGRASLYDTFGSKEELFAEAMECYASYMEEELLAPLRGPGPALERLEAFFRRITDSLLSSNQPCCLMIKAAVGRGAADAVIAERINGFMEKYEDAFAGLLTRARSEGELGSDRNPRALARFLRTMMHGLSINASLGQTRRSLRDVLKTAMGSLN